MVKLNEEEKWALRIKKPSDQMYIHKLHFRNKVSRIVMLNK